MTMQTVLVVGLGIAGMATAVALRKTGLTPVVVERAPQRRTGGYFIGLFPEGQEAAQQLGVYDEIHVRDAHGENWEQHADGSRDPGIGFIDQPGRPDGLLRGDVEAGLWSSIDGQIEVRFGTTPISIVETGEKVTVTFDNAGRQYTESFDIVVGADGLRSTVRKLHFGPHAHYLKSMDAIICAYEFSQQVPEYGAQDSVVVAEPGRSLWVFPFSDRPPTALFTYRTDDIDAQFRKEPLDVLRGRFADISDSPVISHALAELEKADEKLFDSVQQVRMKRWRKGRVVLVGDAAWCLTLYSGMGAKAGLMGGYELGRLLEANAGNLGSAGEAWEARMRPFVRRHQRRAYFMRELFVPSNRVTATIRRLALKVMARKLARSSHGIESAGYLPKTTART